MGSELLLASLAIRRDRDPDWLAAAQAIDRLDLATILDTGDDFFPWESWLWDAPDVPHPVGVYAALRAAQADLRRAAANVRDAIEDPGPKEALVIELPEHRVYVTGGVTPGPTPSSLFDPFTVFAEGGVARAAGFEWCSQYASNGLGERRLRFNAEETRGIRATRAFMFAEDAAMRDRGALAGEPERWFAWLKEPLDAARDAGKDAVLRGRQLMNLMARLAALVLMLERRAPDGAAWDEGVLEYVELFDDVGTLPPWSAARLVEQLARELDRFDDLLPVLAGRGDVQHANALTEFTGASLPRTIATELFVHLMRDGLLGIADIYGDELDDIRPATFPVPIEPELATWTGDNLDYREYIAWCAVREFDWDAAAHAIAAVEDDAEQLRADLAEFRAVVDGGYNRLVSYEDLDDLRIWMTAGEWRDGWTLVDPLRRLGQAGVLSAAGAVAWR